MATNYQVNGSDIENLAIPRDLFAQGGLWGWGWNSEGQLGAGNTGHRSSPVQTIASGTNWRQVSGAQDHAAAIKTDGTLWTWGKNINGRLGTGNTTHRSSPVQTIAGGTNWQQVSCGEVTAAIKTDGTLWLWGSNNIGQLGTGNTTHRSSPVQTIASGTNWKQVSAQGGATVAAIKTDGTLWLWGNNLDGQLGTGDVNRRSSPVQTVAGGTNWKQVSTGSTTAAIKTDGTLWTWGSGFSGKLGNGTNIAVSSPIQTIAGGTNWRQVSVGLWHTAAIKTDGTLWSWGQNWNGEFGDGTNVDKSSPVQTISGGTNWKSVNVGNSVTVAIKTDGTLWAWGINSDGQLGDNTRTYRSSPVQTVAGGSNWKLVSTGTISTFAITDIF